MIATIIVCTIALCVVLILSARQICKAIKQPKSINLDTTFSIGFVDAILQMKIHRFISNQSAIIGHLDSINKSIKKADDRNTPSTSTL